MKKMTCKQLGGACDFEFQAGSFEEIVELSKNHGMEMFQKNDADHIDAMKAIKRLMKSPEAMQAWFQNKRKEFETLPEE